jgi:hypothetical protein
MLVRATKKLFYDGGIRAPGDERQGLFVLTDPAHFSASCMVKVSDIVAAPNTAKTRAAAAKVAAEEAKARAQAEADAKALAEIEAEQAAKAAADAKAAAEAEILAQADPGVVSEVAAAAVGGAGPTPVVRRRSTADQRRV